MILFAEVPVSRLLPQIRVLIKCIRLYGWGLSSSCHPGVPMLRDIYEYTKKLGSKPQAIFRVVGVEAKRHQPLTTHIFILLGVVGAKKRLTEN